jgi:hypothetical protein
MTGRQAPLRAGGAPGRWSCPVVGGGGEVIDAMR